MPSIVGLCEEHSNKNKISQKPKSIPVLQSTQSINHLPAFIKAIEPIIKTNELDEALKKYKYE